MFEDSIPPTDIAFNLLLIYSGLLILDFADLPLNVVKSGRENKHTLFTYTSLYPACSIFSVYKMILECIHLTEIDCIQSTMAPN